MIVKKHNKFFSLVELLIVVAVIAIISGGAISVYSGIQKRSAKGEAISALTSIEQSFNNFVNVERGNYPSNYDSSIQLTFDAAQDPTDASYHATPAPHIIDNMSTELSGFIDTSIDLPDNGVQQLLDAGITSVRYVDDTASDGGTPTLQALDTGAVLTDAPGGYEDLPNGSQIFEAPLGRGLLGYGGAVNFSASTDTVYVALWNPGANWSDNIRVGAEEGDILIAFGIGNNCTIVNTDTASTNVNSANSYLGLNKAPEYGWKAQNYTYGRFIALFKVARYENSSGVVQTLVSGKFAALVDGTNFEAIEGGARLVGVVDCFGNTLIELKNQYNERNQ